MTSGPAYIFAAGRYQVVSMDEVDGRRGAASAPGPVRPGAFSAILKELVGDDSVAEDARWHRGLTAVRPGAVIGRFELVREIGRGGFGVVFEARDRELGRAVAFKAVRAGSRPNIGEGQILREAEAAAQLAHPNIVTIHDVGRSEFGPYLVLELLKGQTLADRLGRGPLPLPEALRIGIEVAKALTHAHSRGVFHRDLTPGNVFLCDDRYVKVLDLGMARAFGTKRLEGGTPGYMAPEQRRGAPEDERTDIFALGAILHRMLAQKPLGSRAGAKQGSRLRALKIPGHPALGVLVRRMLDEDPVKRPRDASEVLAALTAFATELDDSKSAAQPQTRAMQSPSPRSIGIVTLVAVVIAAMGFWFVRRESRIRWAVGEALPQLSQLVEHGEYSEAFALAEKVEHFLPEDPRLVALWPRLSHRLGIETTPAGADVFVRNYAARDPGWRYVGKTPITSLRLPLEPHQLRIEKKGFASVQRVPKLVALGPVFGPWRNVIPEEGGTQVETLRIALYEVERFPPEMVHVPGETVAIDIPGLDHLPPVRLGDYLIDRTEVTNEQFKRFVYSGGYLRPELWQHSFVKDGRALSWNEAMALFRDRTGRPGPATWESGDYPEGQGDLPVTGVSWYEAAAYAVFVEKTLPNVYQWSHASGAWASSQIIPRSNFRGQGLAPVASYRGMGPFGTYDMAGNAKEWCWNASGSKRYVLGGAWNEPEYMFNAADADSPFAREPTYGFRLARALGNTTDPAASLPISSAPTDYSNEMPVSPDLFQVFKRMYAYERRPLDARVEAAEDTDRWRKEKVTFTAAYGGERIIGYLFTPRRVMPPYHTVVFFPGIAALLERSSDDLLFMRILAMVIYSGRAVFYPVYKSTYERGDGLTSEAAAPTASYRAHVIQWSNDLGRSIDYIETREDLDSRRLAFYGLSWGARLGPLLVAVEDRIRVAILLAGGLRGAHSVPETEPFNFAPYVRQPILMLNGRYDFLYRIDSAELLFKRLGPSEKDKRHVIFDSPHVLPIDSVTKEVLDWLDRYLGSTGR
jgi:formylglycine-generating enzyme required for sulfatase activity/dienelactone hydrolase